MTGFQELAPAKAALERGRGVVIVGPPAVEQTPWLWELLPSARAADAPPTTLIVTNDTGTAVEWSQADSSAPVGGGERVVHPVTGLDRTIRLLGEGQIDVLAGTATDLTALASRAVLNFDAVQAVVLAWPEAFASGGGEPEVLDSLLAQLPGARRIVLSWNPSVLEPLLERHAPRPHLLGHLPLDADGRPRRPVGGATRYLLIPRDRRPAATRDVLDAINRPDVFVWSKGATCPPQADAVLCLDLPTYDELQAIAASGSPVLLISPGQLAYTKSIAASLTALALPAAARLARTAADSVRTEVQARLEAGHLELELAILEPLLERYDPIEVAAAALAVRRSESASAPSPTPAPSGATPQRGSAGETAFAKLFVNVGKKDRVGAKDLVGALTREVGLAREQIGRIVVRDAFSVVEIEPAAAERAVRGLSTTTIRSRRVQARPYRET